MSICCHKLFYSQAGAYEMPMNPEEKKNVILGGIHPSALPDEAITHADSVCMGS